MPNFLDTFHGNPRKSSPYAIYNTRFEDATVLAVDPKAMTARLLKVSVMITSIRTLISPKCGCNLILILST